MCLKLYVDYVTMTSGKGVLKGGQKKSSGLKQHIFGYSTDWPFISSDALYFFLKSEKVKKINILPYFLW